MSKVGVSTPLPAYTVDPAFTARKAEELGFESIWYAEHPVMPVESTSRFPGLRRRRDPVDLLALHGPLHRAGKGLRGYQRYQARHGHHPDSGA